MDLFDHVKNLKPMAEAIVYLAENVEEVSQIEDKLHSLRSDIAFAEERLGQIAKAALEHGQMAEQAKATVIEGQSRLEQMIAGANAEAKRIMAQAKSDVDSEIQRSRIKFRSEEIKFQEGIAALRAQKETLVAEVADKTKEHNAVLASMASLGKRLGAA